ncbi:MAG: hypothetical protein AAF959_15210 [Cyanobacteria bacterium P01_D01_bin.56]
MEESLFYVVRITSTQFKKGSSTTEFLAEATQYESEDKATQAAGPNAIGLSEYSLIGGKPEALRHINLTKQSAAK